MKIESSRMRRPLKWLCAVFALVMCNYNAIAQDYSEGWYQIKRTVNIASLADMDFSGMSGFTGVTSLFTNVSYLNTTDEFTTSSTIPVLNINVGTSVYGATLMDVDGTKDYTADLTSANGRNANEQYLTTYFYITPVGTDDDGSWRYTVRSANGHYIGPDGKYYVDAKEVYLNSSLGISLGDSLDAILNSMMSSLGVSIGSKQYTLSTSFVDDIPYIDRLDIYTTLQPLIEKLGDMGVKMSQYSWTKKTATADDVETSYVGSTAILETLSNMAQDVEQLLSYYNDEDYASLGRMLMKYVGLDLFKLKKVNISNITTSVGLVAKHTSVTPYTVRLIGFGDSFSLDAIDYRTADLLTKLSQKTNQNAMVEYTGDGAQANSITKLYDGGTLFVKKGGSVGDGNYEFCLVTDNGTDVVNLSRAQYQVVVDDNAQVVNVIVSSSTPVEVLGVATGKWNDNYKTISLDKSGVATLTSPFQLTIPDDEKGVFGNIKKHAPKVYVAAQIKDGKLLCEEVGDYIPANTPVIISGDASQSYNFTVVEPESAASSVASMSKVAAEGNILKGTFVDYSVPDDVNVYMLDADEQSNPQFVLLSGESRLVPAWHAYYETAQGEETPESIAVVLDGDTSYVELITVDSDNQSKCVYDLSGRHVSTEKLSPGVYIINGAKIVRR